MCDSLTWSTSARWLRNSGASQSAHRHRQLVCAGADANPLSGSSFTEQLSGVSGWLLFVASDPQEGRSRDCEER